MSDQSWYDDADTGRHPVNVGHLVMGIAFLGIVGIWALVEGDVVGGDEFRWLAPLPWVVAGAAGLLAIALGSRRRRARTEPTGPTHDDATGERSDTV